MSMSNNRRERRQKTFSHQVILCTVWKILEYLYCMEKGHFTVVLSWLIGVSLLGGLALGRAGWLLQIQRWNALMFHFCIIFIYDIMWLHRRKQSRNHHWKPIFFFKLCPWCNNPLLGGEKNPTKPQTKKSKNQTKYPKTLFLMCEWWCNESVGFLK